MIPAAVYIIAGYDVVINAVKHVIKGKFLDENALMTIASICAFVIGEYAEACAVMLFYQVGEMIQDSVQERSERSITALCDIRPDTAVIIKNGSELSVPAQDVKIGEVIIVRPGERIPIDGEVISGESFLDTSALTGESVPRRASVGDTVLSGSQNTEGVLKIKTTAGFENSAASRILKLTRSNREKKAKAERFITTFAKYYTPAVVALALIIAVVFPFFDGMSFAKWVYRGCIFLVLSCPCALVISVPLTLFAGIGAASSQGIMIKGGAYLESLTRLETVAFDKTGTLSEGIFTVTEVSSDKALELAAMCEYYSTHPIARAVTDSYNGEIDTSRISGYTEIAGRGVSALIDGTPVLCGSILLMKDNGIQCEPVTGAGSVVYIAAGGKFAGYITVSDRIKSSAKAAVAELSRLGAASIMLTGDRESEAEAAAEAIGISNYRAGLLPEDKSSILSELLKNKSKNRTVAFCGDGINDAPSLTLADIGIAMGGLGSDSAVEASDVVIMNDNPMQVANAVKLAKSVRSIMWQNIILSIGVKLIVMLLGAFGLSNMWWAMFADVGVAVIAILNSLRALYIKVK